MESQYRDLCERVEAETLARILTTRFQKAQEPLDWIFEANKEELKVVVRDFEVAVRILKGQIPKVADAGRDDEFTKFRARYAERRVEFEGVLRQMLEVVLVIGRQLVRNGEREG